MSGGRALVFAATGAIGGEVARSFARGGVHVWRSGRDRADLVDATNRAAVAADVDRVAVAARSTSATPPAPRTRSSIDSSDP